MRYIFFVCVWVLSGLLLTNQPSQAQSGADGTTFHKIIKNQMNAFASGDAVGAFSFANSDLQKRYQTPDVFMEMVKQGYQPVYHPRDVTFGALKDTRQGPVQEVYVTGPKGGNWLALYSFEQQADGSWRISGCYLTESDGGSA